MISFELARRLRGSGLTWSPTRGDAFAVPDRDLDGEVFVLSDMVVELVDLPDGVTVLGFNGTTEWALDNLEVDEAVWLPREDQLRELLGASFVRLERVPGPPTGWAAVVRRADAGPEQEVREVDVGVADAYARALLALRGA